MRDALGLSIGTANLVATGLAGDPIIRRSVLTVWDHDRQPDAGVPAQADWSAHRSESLLVMTLEAMVRAVGSGPPAAVAIAVPAHWGPPAVAALNGALQDSPTFSAGGAPPVIVSDATAALAALQASPGLPDRGVVVLCDFGASGSSITLVDAGAGLTPIGPTVRVEELSGDRIDQELLNHVLTTLRVGPDDASGTMAIGQHTRLRQECRLAKERLSEDTAVTVAAQLPGHVSDVELTRAELAEVIAPLLEVFLDALADALEHNRIAAVDLAAIAIVGGGAAIPGLGQKLSDSLHVPLITSPAPGFTAAAGAAVLATRDSAGDAPTGLAPAAWAASTAGRAATESASDGSPSATFRALAWSQDDDAVEEPAPYTGADFATEQQVPEYAGVETGPTVELDAGGQDHRAAVLPLPWFRRPALIFGVAATLASVAVGGLAIKLTDSPTTPTTKTTRVTRTGEAPETVAPAPPPPATVTVTGGNGQTIVTTAAPPEPSTTTAAPSSTTTTTTTTTTPSTTTTTTTTTTTSTTTTTTPTTTSRTTTTTTPTTTVPTSSTAPSRTTRASSTAASTAATTAAATTAAPAVTTTLAPAITTQAATPAEPAATSKPAPAG